MKRRITQAEFDKLSSELQALYTKAEGSDNFNLDLEDDDGGDALKRAKDREKKRADEAEKKAKEAQARLDELEAEAEERRAQEGKGLDEAGVTKLQAKHARELAAAQKAAEDAKSKVTALTVDRTANELAAELSTVPDIFASTIRSRLAYDETDGVPSVIVLGEDGQPSGKTLADFKAELLATPRFAPILVASKASGGGASGGLPGGGATGKKLSDMTATEEAMFANEHPDAYTKMVAEG